MRKILNHNVKALVILSSYVVKGKILYLNYVLMCINNNAVKGHTLI